MGIHMLGIRNVSPLSKSSVHTVLLSRLLSDSMRRELAEQHHS